MNAPKGMGLFGNKLYVADISEVVVVDVKNAKIEKKIQIDGAEGLNDITVNSKGVVYVSDSKKGKIYRIENDEPSLYMSDMEGVNGLKAVGSDLYILTKAGVQKADAAKNITQFSDVPGGDGIEPVGNGDFIVSHWMGVIYYVFANGTKQQLLDTRPEKKSTADIGYNPVKKIVYVPTFFGKTIAAYQLK
jgi:hypothetical protein